VEEDHTRRQGLGPAVIDDEIRRVEAMTAPPIQFDVPA
jgi:hypothetical protein